MLACYRNGPVTVEIDGPTLAAIRRRVRDAAPNQPATKWRLVWKSGGRRHTPAGAEIRYREVAGKK